MSDSPSAPDPAPESRTGGLPEPLEDRAYDVLLGGGKADRDAAFAALLAAHPEHAAGLRRLAASLRSAENALADTGLAEPPPPVDAGPYRLLSKLGEGGFGVVWLAEQRVPLQRQVAVKLIRPGMHTANVLRRFEAERDLLARFDHPCIAKVLDAGQTDAGQPFLVTEYVDGVPLTQYATRHQLSLRARVALLAKVAEGVQHAHQRGVIHRDLKPSNVLVVEVDGVAWPKIIDFGIARAVAGRDEPDERTRAGLLLGTPEYMSPEQALGRGDVDVRTDVHALGVMLFELLTGDLPFGRERWRRAGISEIVAWIKNAETPRPSAVARDPATARALRGDLDWVVSTACARERERRYASARDLAADLSAYLGHRPVAAGPPGAGYQLRKFARRHRAALAAGATVFSALVGGLVVSLRALDRARDAERAATARGDELRRVVGQYAGLADVVACRELKRRAQELWPARPVRAAGFRAWLADARALLDGRAARAVLLADVRARAERDDDGAARFLAEALERLDGELAEFDGDDGLVARSSAGLAWAEQVAATTLDDAADEWRAAAAAIATSERYGGLVVAPQLGLVPLGFDPDSGLFEFWHAQSGARPTRDDQGRLHPHVDDGIVLVLLPGGTAQVGATNGPAGAPFRDPFILPRMAGVRTVTLRPFLIGKYEVTRAQWRRARLPGGTYFENGTETGQGPLDDLHPADNLSRREAATLAAQLDLELPTDAQWEYACRAGSTTVWSTGDDVTTLKGFANVAGNELADGTNRPLTIELRDRYALSSPIGTYGANAFGLHDMHGNIAELCADCWLGPEAVPQDGDGRLPGYDERVFSVRGGSFGDPATRARSAARQNVSLDGRTAIAGVRLARALRD